MDKTSIGDRMKRYEATNKTYVLPRTPVIIRADGKAFHSWTKNINAAIDPSMREGPFSEIMHTSMQNAALFAMKQMQNVEFVYIQSDEISFYLRDWVTHETQQWFGGNVQKMASITASAVTVGFIKHVTNYMVMSDGAKWPMFDARVFQVPAAEVANYFIWRQQDATRNSINMLGQYYFSHKQLHGKSTSDVQDMLVKEQGVNWNDLTTWKKRGSAIYREIDEIDEQAKTTTDADIPIFTQNRGFIERLV